VRRVVNAHLGAIRACYETEAQRHPELHGSVVVTFQIEPDGTVSTASLGASTLESPRMESCLLRQVRGWSFPASDQATYVGGYPFRFGVQGG
jgi:TonB family protein